MSNRTPWIGLHNLDSNSANMRVCYPTPRAHSCVVSARFRLCASSEGMVQCTPSAHSCGSAALVYATLSNSVVEASSAARLSALRYGSASICQRSKSVTYLWHALRTLLRVSGPRLAPQAYNALCRACSHFRVAGLRLEQFWGGCEMGCAISSPTL